MPRVSDVERATLFGPDGQVLGTVEHVLFHPSEPHVVGFEVRPTRMLYVIDRKPVYVPLANVTFGEEGTVQALRKDPQVKRPEGFEWEKTVVWRGMPARTAKGGTLGCVHDAGFTRKSGRVTWLEVSEGAVSDVAVGRSRMPGEMAEGFDGTHVVVSVGDEHVRGSGGLAKTAGSGAAYAKVHGERLAKKALAGGTDAAIRVGKSLKEGKARSALDKARETALRWFPDDEDERG